MWQTGYMQKHLFVTLNEAFWGLLVGLTSGTGVGLILGLSRKLSQVSMPLFVGLNSIPKLALAPMLVVWFGIGISSKIAISAVMVFFVFAFNIFSGYRNTDVSLINALRLLGASKWNILRHVILPSCLPWFLSSLRLGLGLSLTGAIVGEFIGASHGLGWLINTAGAFYDITQVLACVLTIVIIMMTLDFGVRYLETRTLKWRKHIHV